VAADIKDNAQKYVVNYSNGLSIIAYIWLILKFLQNEKNNPAPVGNMHPNGFCWF
jgi:hypothetical protein